MSKVSNIAKVLDHVEKAGYIDTNSALLNLGMAGGTLTKVLSEIRRHTNYDVRRYSFKNPITGVRYSSYYIDRYNS